MQSQKHALLEAAYMFYYATDVAFQVNAESLGLLRRRLLDLIGDALILADQVRYVSFVFPSSISITRYRPSSTSSTLSLSWITHYS
jgi:Myristoyl-CoA:protein N-myristoyltransferase, C-terminal domain